MLDNTRPCDSKNRKKNRYTKSELLEIASRLKPQPANLKKMTIDHLCQLLKKPRKTLVEKVKVPSPTSPHLCRLNPDRPCDAKSRKPNRYKREELVALWNASCAKLSKAKPKKIDEYCDAIKSISFQKKETPRKELTTQKNTLQVENLSQIAAKKIARFMLNSLIAKKKKQKPFGYHVNIRLNKFPVYIPLPRKQPKTVGKNLLALLNKIEKNKLENNNQHDDLFLTFDCHERNLYFKNQPEKDVYDPHALFNRNLVNTDVFRKNKEWIEEQGNYIHQLKWDKKLIVLAYTYGGDKMLNQKLLGVPIDSRNIIPVPTTHEEDSPYSRYLHCVVFPLAIFLFKDIKSSSTAAQFIENITDQKLKKPFERLFTKIKPQTFTKSYGDLFEFFVKHRDDFPEDLLEQYIDRFDHELRQILKHAPKTKEQFWVFRGITKKEYVLVGDTKRFVFKNNLYMSTSFDLCKAGFFKNRMNSCCIQQILVPKGVACLFISLLSFFPTENEVLFGPGAFLYPMTDDFMASNVNVLTRKFFIAN